ncbi:uncharacterized protein BCR38DRAFT_124030 [Pseudomassariella vexata]|uniref:Uncharacterized protein n=1 Tax=Pseudomassariella vexata TaxID=1141098 RepID=A0A1Y2D9T5_9PEZI|nr:uncharacterized protein BCR38DRAFT_124030 [Pseudomassariella vexata]ORY55435.1 hypothetical protein BCR38DRAFT_124030 [Pseudomassariella vexata]
MALGFVRPTDLSGVPSLERHRLSIPVTSSFLMVAALLCHQPVRSFVNTSTIQHHRLPARIIPASQSKQADQHLESLLARAEAPPARQPRQFIF